MRQPAEWSPVTLACVTSARWGAWTLCTPEEPSSTDRSTGSMARRAGLARSTVVYERRPWWPFTLRSRELFDGWVRRPSQEDLLRVSTQATGRSSLTRKTVVVGCTTPISAGCWMPTNHFSVLPEFRGQVQVDAYLPHVGLARGPVRGRPSLRRGPGRVPQAPGTKGAHMKRSVHKELLIRVSSWPHARSLLIGP